MLAERPDVPTTSLCSSGTCATTFEVGVVKAGAGAATGGGKTEGAKGEGGAGTVAAATWGWVPGVDVEGEGTPLPRGADESSWAFAAGRTPEIGAGIGVFATDA